MATPAGQQDDSRNLLELAIDVHTDLNKLATGLAHAGANPQAVAGLTKMAGMIGDIAKLLGSGPVGGGAQPGAGPSPAGPGPAPGPGGPPPEAGPPQAAPGPPQPAAGPPAGVTPGERPSALHAATAHLQAALAAAKTKAP